MIPWSVQVELTEGCNRKCSWCSVPTTTQGFKFMTVGLAKILAVTLHRWIPQGRRIEFALAGEPLVNPNHLTIISIFRAFYPKCQLLLTTNGLLLLKDFSFKVQQLFDAGLNILLFSMYEPEAAKLRECITEFKAVSNGVEIIDFATSKEAPWRFYNNAVKKLFMLRDIPLPEGRNKVTKVLNNHAGSVKNEALNIFPLAIPLQKKCTRVFRELDIGHDGTVLLCCVDLAKRFVFKNALNYPLPSIWNSTEFNIVRTLLYRKSRDLLTPCKFCNYAGGFRQGIGLYDIFPNKSNESLMEDLLCYRR